MYLVKDRRYGLENYVFLRTDPRRDGYEGEVTENVQLDPGPNYDHWKPGEPRLEPHLGRSRQDHQQYKVFRSREELEHAGYEFVAATSPVEIYSWWSYLRLIEPKTRADVVPANEWFSFLDEVDEGTKKVRAKEEVAEPGTGSTNEQVAEWVARRHLGADGGIRQVVYLPAGAPPDEIRLIEVSERIARSEDAPLEPFDFRSEVAGRPFKILVADVTKSQLADLKADPTKLPAGWDWGGSRVFGGGA